MNEPQIKELSYKRRQIFFFVLVAVFLVSLPALIFYTTGYRLDFDSEETSIVSTGGIYVTTDNLEVDVYIDGVQVEQPRLFRSAYYVQNITAGQHRVVVQRPDLTTWVKELPVDAHIVIEAAAFNMPLVPHLRPIPKYATATGTPVYVKDPTLTKVLETSSTIVPIAFTTSRRLSNYDLNQEYPYVASLFSSSSTSTRSVFDRLLDEVERFRFSTSSPLGLEYSTTTDDSVKRGDMQIVEREGELYARWSGGVTNIPYYFCVTDAEASSTALRYGRHIADQVEELRLSTTTPLIIDGTRVCRPEIQLDRLRQDVYFYDFYPDSRDLVIMQLEDGLYVTEIDDRAWQNVQLIYPGTDFQVVIENGEIFIHQGEHYFQVVTEIEPI